METNIIDDSAIKVKTEILEDEPSILGSPNLSELRNYIKIEEGYPSDDTEENAENIIETPNQESSCTSHKKRKHQYDDAEWNSDLEKTKILKNCKSSNADISLRTYMAYDTESGKYNLLNYYQCPECPFNSRQLRNFDKHFQNHIGNFGEKCTYCSFRATKAAVKTHELIHEKKRQILKCRLCSFVITGNKTLRQHLLLEHNISPTEDQSIMLAPVLSKHINSDNVEIKREITSPVADNLEENIVNLNCDQPDSDDKQKDRQHEKEETNQESSKNCEDILKVQTALEDFTDDLKPVKDPNEEIRGVDNSSNPYVFCDINGIKWFKCAAEGCPFKTNTYIRLKRHRINHTIKGPLKCRYCSFCCKGQGMLTSHLLQHVEAQNNTGMPYIHMNTKQKKRFSCTVDGCPYETEDFHYLKRHRASHERKKHFKCQYCSFICKSGGDLKSHLIQHDKAINIISEKSAISPKNKKNHQDEFQHKVSKQPKYRYAPKSYRTYLKYNTLLRQYYYQCPECPFKNKNQKIFYLHHEKHKMTVGEKCPYCTFRGTKLRVKVHKLVHEKRNLILKCNLCPTKMTKRLALEHHLKHKHNILSPNGLSSALLNKHINNELEMNDNLDIDGNNTFQKQISSPNSTILKSRNYGHNTVEQRENEDDIISVIIKEKSPDHHNDDFGNIESFNDILRRRVLGQSTQSRFKNQSNNSDSESEIDIRAVILKRERCDLNIDSRGTKNENLNEGKHTITITITTSENCNDDDLIKNALVAEILKSFDVSNKHLSNQSGNEKNLNHDSNQQSERNVENERLIKTAAVADILKSFDISNEEGDCSNLSNNNKKIGSKGNSQELSENSTSLGMVKTDVITDILKPFEVSDEGEESCSSSTHIKQDRNLNKVDAQIYFEESNKGGIARRGIVADIYEVSEGEEQSSSNSRADVDQTSNETDIQKCFVKSNNDRALKAGVVADILKSFDVFGNDEEYCSTNIDKNQNMNLNEADISKYLGNFNNDGIVKTGVVADILKSFGVSDDEEDSCSSDIDEEQNRNLNESDVQKYNNGIVKTGIVGDILKSFDVTDGEDESNLRTSVGQNTNFNEVDIHKCYGNSNYDRKLKTGVVADILKSFDVSDGEEESYILRTDIDENMNSNEADIRETVENSNVEILKTDILNSFNVSCVEEKLSDLSNTSSTNTQHSKNLNETDIQRNVKHSKSHGMLKKGVVANILKSADASRLEEESCSSVTAKWQNKNSNTADIQKKFENFNNRGILKTGIVADILRSFDVSSSEEESCSSVTAKPHNTNLNTARIHAKFENSNNDGILKTRFVGDILNSDVSYLEEEYCGSITNKQKNKSLNIINVPKSIANSSNNGMLKEGVVADILKSFDVSDSEEESCSSVTAKRQNTNLNTADIHTKFENSNNDGILKTRFVGDILNSDVSYLEEQYCGSIITKQKNKCLNKSIAHSSYNGMLKEGVVADILRSFDVSGSEEESCRSVTAKRHNTNLNTADIQIKFENSNHDGILKTRVVGDILKSDISGLKEQYCCSVATKQKNKSLNNVDVPKSIANSSKKGMLKEGVVADILKSFDFSVLEEESCSISITAKQQNKNSNKSDIQEKIANSNDGILKTRVLADILKSFDVSVSEEGSSTAQSQNKNLNKADVQITLENPNNGGILNARVVADILKSFDVSGLEEGSCSSSTKNQKSENFNKADVRTTLENPDNDGKLKPEVGADISISFAVSGLEEKSSSSVTVKRPNKTSYKDDIQNNNEIVKTGVVADILKSFDVSDLEEGSFSASTESQESRNLNKADVRKMLENPDNDGKLKPEVVADISMSFAVSGLEEESSSSVTVKRPNKSSYKGDIQNNNGIVKTGVVADILKSFDGSGLEESCSSSKPKQQNKNLNNDNFQKSFGNRLKGDLTKTAIVSDTLKLFDISKGEIKSSSLNDEEDDDGKNMDVINVEFQQPFKYSNHDEFASATRVIGILKSCNSSNSKLQQNGDDGNKGGLVRTEIVADILKSFDISIEEKESYISIPNNETNKNINKVDVQESTEKNEDILAKTAAVGDILKTVDVSGEEANCCAFSKDQSTCSRIPNSLRKIDTLKCNDIRPYKTHDILNPQPYLVFHYGKEPLECEYCTFRCRGQANLTQHVLKHAQERSHTGVQDGVRCTTVEQISEPLSPKKMKASEECDYFSDNLYSMKRHIHAHKNKKEIRLFNCPLCPRQYRQKRSLNSHLERNHSECSKTLDCTECPLCRFRMVPGAKHIISHLKVHVVKDRDMFSCLFCEVQHAKRSAIMSHIRTAHRKYLRDISIPINKDEDDLNRNKASGNENVMEMAKKCSPYNEKLDQEQCQNGKVAISTLSASSSNDYNHMREKIKENLVTEDIECNSQLYDNRHTFLQKNPINSELLKPNQDFFKCTTTNKSITSHHININRNSSSFQCTYCPAKLPQEKSYKNHLKLHFNTRGIQCPLCTYKNKKPDLLKHLSCHVINSNGVFRCPLCKSDKRSKENMNDHLKVVHSVTVFQEHDSVCKWTCNGSC